MDNENKSKSLIKIETLLWMIIKGIYNMDDNRLFKTQHEVNIEIDKQYEKFKKEMGE